jgi:hypothetical protein
MVFETKPLLIDRIYTSMTGPHQRIDVDYSELECVTAIRTEVIDDQSGQPIGGEFFCHSQLQLANNLRPVVMATGISEIRLPEGFGLPVREMAAALSNEKRPLTFLGMVLNNHEGDINRRVRVRATVEYLPEERAAGMSKLWRVEMPMTVKDLERYRGPVCEADDELSPHCLLVGEANNHWMVPPGPQRTRKLCKRFPVDLTVHYAAVHLHNHGVYMRLSDTTTNEILWQTNVKNEPDRVQIAEIPPYSSVEGFTLHADHDHEIEAYYENTTDHDVDAMAMMYLFVTESKAVERW